MGGATFLLRMVSSPYKSEKTSWTVGTASGRVNINPRLDFFFSSIQGAIPIASMSQGDQNELSQAEEIKNAEIYFLIISEAQRPKSRFQ